MFPWIPMSCRYSSDFELSLSHPNSRFFSYLIQATPNVSPSGSLKSMDDGVMIPGCSPLGSGMEQDIQHFKLSKLKPNNAKIQRKLRKDRTAQHALNMYLAFECSCLDGVLDDAAGLGVVVVGRDDGGGGPRLRPAEAVGRTRTESAVVAQEVVEEISA